MPTRKQRRRRAKEQRHEYVWEDAEGNELDPAEARGEPDKAKASRATGRRSRREPLAPSWRRTLKRGAIFAPIMFVTVTLLSNDLTLAQQIMQTALIVAIFLPFSYLLDRVFWRSYQRKIARRERAGGGAQS
jgi:hypothetical protein